VERLQAEENLQLNAARLNGHTHIIAAGFATTSCGKPVGRVTT